MQKKVLTLVTLATLLIGVWFFLKNRPADISRTESVETHVTNSGTTVPSIEAPVTENVPELGDDESIQDFLDAEKKLPTLAQAKTWSEEEIHGTPKAVLESGKDIGRLIDAAEKNPARREPTLRYFLKCAENKEVLPSVRAVCWNSITSKIPDWKVFVPMADADVPESVRVLAGKL